MDTLNDGTIATPNRIIKLHKEANYCLDEVLHNEGINDILYDILMEKIFEIAADIQQYCDTETKNKLNQFYDITNC